VYRATCFGSYRYQADRLFEFVQRPHQGIPDFSERRLNLRATGIFPAQSTNQINRKSRTQRRAHLSARTQRKLAIHIGFY